MAFGHFTELDADECRDLLRTHSLARVGWESAQGPQILPVTYRVDGDDLVFRTHPAGALAELRTGVRVAVQVDALDADTRTGWSVLARGTTSADDGTEALRLWQSDGPQPWVGGDRSLVIRVAVGEVTGRVVAADD